MKKILKEVIYFIGKGCYVGYKTIMASIWIIFIFYIAYNIMDLKDAYILSQLREITLWLGIIGTISNSWITYGK